ncbi:MAG TPA: hypothetical protein VLD61_00145 [Methylomirabilota bacterium]|nr:hypothetical protein [Methylomirabilota bacterium]
MGSRVGQASRLMSTILVAALLASCTAYQPVKVAELPGGLRDGDQVWITLKNGKAASLTVVGLTDDAIRGSGGETISLGDVDTIQVARLDTVATLRTGLIGAGLIVIGLLHFAALALTAYQP